MGPVFHALPSQRPHGPDPLWLEDLRRTERFGAIAQSFSSYASFRHSETEPFQGGINSFQFYWDGTRWWILNIIWSDERAETPLPKEFRGTGR